LDYDNTNAVLNASATQTAIVVINTRSSDTQSTPASSTASEFSSIMRLVTSRCGLIIDEDRRLSETGISWR